MEIDVGEYRPYSNGGRLRIAIGGLVFESKQPRKGSSSSSTQMVSLDNEPLANGAILDRISMLAS